MAPAPGDLVELGRTLRLPLGQLRLQRTPVSGLKRRDKLVLGLLVLALHGAAAYWVSQAPTPELPVVPPQVPPMTIEFAAPAPPVVEPPPPAPRRPWSSTAAAAGRRRTGRQAQTQAEAVPKPVVKQAPKPQPKPVEAPPPRQWPSGTRLRPHHPRRPDNPGIGQRRVPEEPGAGVPADGSAPWLGRHRAVARRSAAQRQAGQIQVQKSSGRDALDAAALAAVKRWSFVPAKQGDVAQTGWVSVPIDFKLR
jgi:protein TonB